MITSELRLRRRRGRAFDGLWDELECLNLDVGSRVDHFKPHPRDVVNKAENGDE